MKKLLLSVATVAMAVLLVSCKEKPAQTQELETITFNITPDNLTQLALNYGGDVKNILDSMGIKELNHFFKEGGPNAQCDNEQFYYGLGTTLELNDVGGTTKANLEAKNAVIIHLSSEGPVCGYMLFHSEEDYNNFVKMIPQEVTQEADYLEFEPKGNDTSWMEGFEEGWYLVDFMLRE